MTFTDAEVRRILSLGPWPPPRVVDPSNRMSGKPEAIAFGARLFADPRISASGTIAWTTCHNPGRAFTDGVPRAQGRVRVDRNTPTLNDVGGQRWYGWDGAHDNLWAQSLRPLIDPREMGDNVAHVAAAVRGHDDLRERYAAVLAARRLPDETVAVDIAKALAATRGPGVGPHAVRRFPHALDAATAPPPRAIPSPSSAASRSSSAPACTAATWGRACRMASSTTSASRSRGTRTRRPRSPRRIRKLEASRYNLLGLFNDDPARATATSTRHVALEHRNYGEFRVPGLRNVARTAPYMHDGSLATLRDVVRHYSNLDEDRLHADGERILKPLDLDKYDVDSLVAFLESLSEPAAPGTPVR